MYILNKISIFSNSHEFIETCLQLNVNIKNIYVEKNCISPEIESLSEKYVFHIIKVDKKNINQQDFSAKVGLMFGFGIKLSGDIIHSHENGIINIHPGNLNHYRGRHPIGWALIERKSEITLTFHKISREFDLGLIVDEYKILIDNFDTEKKVLAKVMLNINRIVLESVLCAVKNNSNLKMVESGRYLPSLKGKFDDIQSLNYTSSMLVGISRAKLDYGGLLIDNQKVGLLYSRLDKPVSRSLLKFFCSDGEYVYAERE